MAKATKQNTATGTGRKTSIQQAGDKLNKCWDEVHLADEELSKDRGRSYIYEARKKHLFDMIALLEKQILLSQAQTPADAYVQVSIARHRLDLIGDADDDESRGNNEIIRELERVTNSLRVWLECRSDFELCPVADRYADTEAGSLDCLARAGIEEAVIHG